jgi:hypothetical protein
VLTLLPHSQMLDSFGVFKQGQNALAYCSKASTTTVKKVSSTGPRRSWWYMKAKQFLNYMCEDGGLRQILQIFLRL